MVNGEEEEEAVVREELPEEEWVFRGTEVVDGTLESRWVRKGEG
jgi:hypothetical protein